MKYKVYKVTPDEKQTLEFQLEVGEVRPGTDSADAAVEYIIKSVRHQTQLCGIKPLIISDGVHLTKWLILDDTDIYWFIPVKRFRKIPEPVKVEYKKLCRLGRCFTKNECYSGGNGNIRMKLKQGICPICGGPAEKL